MNPDVILVPASASMAEAASWLVENEITGAPVVDAAGRCIGVISTSDYAMREHVHRRTARMTMQIQLDARENGSQVTDIGQEPVTEHMTPLVHTVGPDAPIMIAARRMCEEHVHRVIVTDKEGVPIGIVSSLDLVASMVAAVEE